MNKVQFLIQGSAVTPYVVTVIKNGDNLTATCTCPAGSFKQHCKHRIAILHGKNQGIVSNNYDDLKIVKDWIIGTDVENALNDYEIAEREFEIAKTKLSQCKKRLSNALMD